MTVDSHTVYELCVCMRVYGAYVWVFFDTEWLRYVIASPYLHYIDNTRRIVQMATWYRHDTQDIFAADISQEIEKMSTIFLLVCWF